MKEERFMLPSQVKSTTSIEDVIHSRETEATSERHVKFAKEEHSEFSQLTLTELKAKVIQN